MYDIFDYVMVNQFFTNEECESIISDLETGEWINHTWTQQNENGELAKIDKKDFLVQFNHKHNEFFFRCLEEYIKKYINNINLKFSMNGWQPLECGNWVAPRYNKFPKGSFIENHHDHIHSLFDGIRKGIPILSIVGVLNEFEGGEFILSGEKIELQPGSAVIFPSTFMYPHQILSVESDHRYSFVTWGY
jgi:predicted 2-oxoglutarate/Fe(II)-dependent dioxygenase YbiX